MKTVLYTMAAMLILTVGFLIGERVANFIVTPGKALVNLSVIDSLKNIPPVVIYRTDTLETIVYKDRLIPTPESTPEPGVLLYTDQIVNAYSRLIIRDWIRGELVDREIEYTPYIITKITKEPYPVYIKSEPQRQVRLQAFAGVTVGMRPGVEIGISNNKYYLSGQYNGYFGLTLGRKFTIY